jgi:GTP-binding protein
VFQYFATHDPSSSTALPVPPATVDFVRSITDEERKAALTFFTKNAAFLASSVAAPNLPAEDQPEFAFVGRSNVGKSSLLNALLSKPLARTSNTPGRTQTINYYQAGNVKLVDLPGYGYAKAPVRMVREWQQFVNTFLTTRKSLYNTSVLVDSRRGITDKDAEVIQMLNTHGLPHQVVLTKADKLSRREIFVVLAETKERIKRSPFCSPIIYITSKDGLGVDELRIGLMRAAKSNQI